MKFPTAKDAAEVLHDLLSKQEFAEALIYDTELDFPMETKVSSMRVGGNVVNVKMNNGLIFNFYCEVNGNRS